MITNTSEAAPARRNSEDPVPSGEILKLLVDAVEDYAIFALDRHGIILTWNLGGLRLKGYSASEVIGTHFSRFYTQADIDRDHPNHELQIAAETGKYEEEGWRVRKNGETFWANIVITALRDEGGALRGFGKVTRDLTTKRNAEIALRESEERFRLMVSNVTDYAIIMLNSAGNISSWNAGAERIKGYSAKDILGKHFSSFYPRSEVEDGKPEMELKIARAEGRYEEEGWRVRKDGTMFWANVTITAVRTEGREGAPGSLVGFAKVTRDLTERKVAEDKLRAAYSDLEDKIAVRTQELSKAKDKAEEAVKARDRFFSIASHELKTPLSSLKLQAQIRKRCVAKGDYSDFEPEKLAELCEDDERQIGRLAFLVDNMLDISKLTTGNFHLKFENLELGRLTHDVVKAMDPVLREAGCLCSFTATTEVQGNWDRHRLEQVITNLLANAAKYASGKPVNVTVGCDANIARISIRDYGPGISKSNQKRIFKPYERLGNEFDASGLGLGLYIVKQIIEAHGGQILLQSKLGEGALFAVELPMSLALPAEEVRDGR